MDTSSPSTRALARRLLAVEGALPKLAGANVYEAVRVCEKLRVSLTRLAGPDGFTALLRRALALAGAEHHALRSVKFKPDGSLEGLEVLAADASSGADAAAAVVAHLLDLLITFIGTPLTRRLVREAWPEASLDD